MGQLKVIPILLISALIAALVAIEISQRVKADILAIARQEDAVSRELIMNFLKGKTFNDATRTIRGTGATGSGAFAAEDDQQYGTATEMDGSGY
jgi:hypothetical protein